MLFSDLHLSLAQLISSAKCAASVAYWSAYLQHLPFPLTSPVLSLHLPSWLPPASKCLLTLLGNLFSPRLTCTVSSAYGSDKLIKCAERTTRSPFPPSAPRRRLIQTSAAASKAPKISLAINTVTERGVCRAKVNTKSAGIFVVLRTT